MATTDAKPGHDSRPWVPLAEYATVDLERSTMMSRVIISIRYHSSLMRYGLCHVGKSLAILHQKPLVMIGITCRRLTTVATNQSLIALIQIEQL